MPVVIQLVIPLVPAEIGKPPMSGDKKFSLNERRADALVDFIQSPIIGIFKDHAAMLFVVARVAVEVVQAYVPGVEGLL